MKISHEAEVAEFGFSELVGRIRDTIRRRWLTLALVAAVIFAAGATLVMLMPPKYSAVARVRIDPSRSLVPTDAASDMMSLTPEAIETEVSILRSLEVARKVVRDQKLLRVPELTKGLNDGTGPQLNPQEMETAVANNMLAQLDVSRDKLTYILGVRFTARNPQLAARVANAVVRTYLEVKVGSKTGTAERQTEWFRKRLDALGNEIRALDGQVAQYRAAAGITQSSSAMGGSTIVDQQIAPLSTQLAMAESDAAAARSNLAAAEGQVARGGPDSVAEVLNSSVIRDLRVQRAEVLRNMGEVQTRYGERHPESIRVRDQLAAIDQQLKDETGRVLSSLRATASATAARASSLRSSMGQLASEQAGNTRSAVLAESLEREAAAKRSQYDKLSQLSLQSTQASTNSMAQAEIVDDAKPPLGPTSPNRPLFLAVVFIVALAGGASVVTVQELMVTGFRTIDEVEDKLGLSVIAAVPNIPKNDRPADLLLSKPTSLYAESMRIARASIIGVRSSNPPKVIAITSALPAEGKTTTSLAFARTLAINNARTLLLECDVRRAVMRGIVSDTSDGPGTVEVLTGEATLEQAITRGDVDGLDHLFVRSPYFSSGNLFGDGEMERLLQTLRGRYDHIVLDLPPIIGLADGRFIAALSDVTAMVVRWDNTPPPAVKTALSWLQADGVPVAGVVLTMVDTGAEAIGGLYYSKKYSGYYQTA